MWRTIWRTETIEKKKKKRRWDQMPHGATCSMPSRFILLLVVDATIDSASNP
jgi:hypothetical protein